MSAFLGVDRFRKSGQASAGRRYFDDDDPVFAGIAIKLDSGGSVIFRSAFFQSVRAVAPVRADRASLTETSQTRCSLEFVWTSAAEDELLCASAG
jgi:hypothetical protein